MCVAFNDDNQECVLCEFCSQMCVSSERLVVDGGQVRPATNFFYSISIAKHLKRKALWSVILVLALDSVLYASIEYI